MKTIHKFLLMITVVMLLCGLFAVTRQVSAAEIVKSGSCGDNVTYTLYNDGELVISGSGAMVNYSSPSPWYNNAVQKVVIENGVTSIGEFAFASCKQLLSITIPSSVTSIDSSAFSGCFNLINLHITDLKAWLNTDCHSNPFGESVKAHKLFIGGELLEGVVVIPNGVTKIPNDAFFRCQNITSVIITDSVISIGDSAFYSCDRLTSVSIPSGVTSIGLSAFSNCTSLTSVVIKDGLRNIGQGAFGGCYRLIKVEIPVSVTTISEGAFANTGVTDIYYQGTKSQWLAVAIADNNSVLNRATVHYQTEIPEEPGTQIPPYKVTALKVIGAGGSALAAPPENGGFIAEVSITEVKQRASNDYFVLAAFDRNGRILGVNYARADIPTGGQISFGMTFPDYGKPIKKIKAFVWESLGGMTPLSETMEL